MFDVARALVLGWALFVACRARAWVPAGVVACAAYLFALEIASGFTIRGEGPQEPMMALVLALIGPSAVPRGPLPGVPLGEWVVRWPLAANAVAACGVFGVAVRLRGVVDGLPQFSEETRRVGRVIVALVLVGVFEGVGAATRLVPWLLEGGG